MANDGFAEHYASLLDGELLKLARQSSELLPGAQHALTAELRKRGLNPPEAGGDESPPLPPVPSEYLEAEVDPDEVVVIRKFRDFPEAMVAKGALDSAGIECFLADENMIRMDWFYSNLLGGLKLAVREEDVNAALDVLEQPLPAEFDVEGLGKFEQPRCPECSSLGIVFESIDKQLSVATMFLNFPVPVPRNRWKCQACGHTWRGSDEPADANPA